MVLTGRLAGIRKKTVAGLVAAATLLGGLSLGMATTQTASAAPLRDSYAQTVGNASFEAARNKYGLTKNMKDGATLHTFMWSFETIKEHMEEIAQAGYSQVRCEMRLIRAALESGAPYGYLHLLSGADLPIKTNDEICRFLQEHEGREFIAFVYRKPNDGRMDDIKERIAIHHPWQERTGRKDDLPTRVLSKAQKLLHVDRLKGSSRLKEIGKGSQWFSITAEFGRYLMEQEPLVERTFRSSYCSDELFIQTMVLNSPFVDSLYDPNGDGCGDNLRLIDWERGAPYVLRSQDYSEIMDAPVSKLFARKFDERVDAAIIRRIADTLLR